MTVAQKKEARKRKKSLGMVVYKQKVTVEETHLEFFMTQHQLIRHSI